MTTATITNDELITHLMSTIVNEFIWARYINKVPSDKITISLSKDNIKELNQYFNKVFANASSAKD